MCEYSPFRERAMTVIDEKTWCDPCITPLVKALNDAGLRTVASCCGHGHRPGNVMLANGQTLLILPDADWDDWLATAIYQRVGDMPGHEPIATPAPDLRERVQALAEIARDDRMRAALLAALDGTAPPTEAECVPGNGCTCLGHRIPGVSHMVPCCDEPHASGSPTPPTTDAEEARS